MQLVLDELKNNVEYLSKDYAYSLREKYIDKFINKNCKHYKDNISVVKECSDGLCYSGYLWDCLKNYISVTFDEINTYRNLLKQVLIFWDIHSKDKIWVEDYWKFGKESVLKINFDILMDNLEYFPEDIYIFDNSKEWTLILTHEDNNVIRVCAKVGNI